MIIRASSPYLSRPLRDFPVLRLAVEEFVRAFEPGRWGIDRFYLHGSFPRAYAGTESFRDIDVAAGSPADLEALQSAPRDAVAFRDPRTGAVRALQVDVLDRPFASPGALLDYIDYGMAKLIYASEDGRVHFHPAYFEDHCGRVARRMDDGPEALPFHSLYRSYKYIAKGFHCRLADVESLLEQCREPAMAAEIRVAATDCPANRDRFVLKGRKPW